MGLSQSQDTAVRESYSQNQRMSKDVSKVGDFLGSGVAGGAIAISQLYLDSENGWAHTEALLATFVTTSALKYTNGRNRPGSDNRYSMPSGHTSTAFATATSLSYSYGWKAAIPGYILATFVAASRWSDDAHWLSDTVAGAFIGYFWGRASSFHHSGILPTVSHDGQVGLIYKADF